MFVRYPTVGDSRGDFACPPEAPEDMVEDTPDMMREREDDEEAAFLAYLDQVEIDRINAEADTDEWPALTF